MDRKDSQTVGQILDGIKELYLTKNVVYGDSYLRCGAILQILFPHGVKLLTNHDHVRYTLIAHIVGDLCRYTHAFDVGGHLDSVDDLIAYGAMLGEVDRMTVVK